MRLVFMGTPAFAVPALEALHAAGHAIAAVYCQPPRPAGRGQKPRPGAVEARARALGLPVLTPATLRGPEAAAAFAAHGAEAAVVAAYGLILPPAILDAPRLGCLNIHASLLPRWRGAAPVQRAILAGDAETGVSIMRMEAGLDTGPVLMAEATPIGPEETAGELSARLAALGARLVVAALDRIGTLEAVPQPARGVTWAAKIDKAEARVDWTRAAAAVARQINGLSPSPGAWMPLRDGRLKLLRARVAGVDPAGSPPGTVLSGFTVACAEGAVEVLEAQREGRRPMPAAELLRGLALPERL
jgi:methionyl-tRNA formyltransferase